VATERGTLSDSGSSASRRFQHMLTKHFEMVSQVVIPQWPFNVDDLTLWRRRAVGVSAGDSRG